MLFDSPFSSPFIVPVAFMSGWVCVTWFRAHYGYSKKHGWSPNSENMAVPPMFQKMLEKAMAERDTEMQQLRERIEVLEKIVAGIPVKRLGEPEEIASIVAWIASDEGGYATGSDFSLNGGLHMG